MPERLDRIEAGGAAGREIAEDDADRRREQEGDGDDLRIDDQRHVRKLAATADRPKPTRMPTRPPNRESTTASTRNCISTWPASAPMASRMPISRVRSVTETSMMFMMPMPPTSRLTPATADSRPVRTPVMPVSTLAIWAMSKTLKSSRSPIPIWRRSRNSSSMPLVTSAVV